MLKQPEAAAMPEQPEAGEKRVFFVTFLSYRCYVK
jgi:hypothetical protein